MMKITTNPGPEWSIESESATLLLILAIELLQFARLRKRWSCLLSSHTVMTNELSTGNRERFFV